jgi:hypothetical protein
MVAGVFRRCRNACHGISPRWPRIGLVLGAWLVGVEAFDADLLKPGEEFADAAVVVDPALGFLGLVFGEVAPDGLVGDFAGPVPVGAVQARGVVVAGAARFAAAGLPFGDRAGQHVG